MSNFRMKIHITLYNNRINFKQQHKKVYNKRIIPYKYKQFLNKLGIFKGSHLNFYQLDKIYKKIHMY